MKTLSLICLLFISCTFTAQSQGSIALNKKTAHDLAGGQRHEYTLQLKANQFALIVVEQQGIDLVINTKNPAGKLLDTFDSPNGRQGPEPLTILSDVAGQYIIEVVPIEENEPAGKYTIELLKSEPKATTPEKQVDQLLSSIVFPGSPGATIAVAQGDKLLLNKGYGSANPEYDIPNTPKTVFHIASISKQFTAFAICMLADQGKLSVDDDIRKYIPELPDFGKKITISQLAYHTSGLRDQWNLLALAGWRLDDVITRDHVLQLMSHQRDLNFAPGDEFSYCNTGYTLMGEIVSRVTGKSFSSWTHENIFTPLGMTNTLFYDDHEKIVKNRAYSFQQSPEGLKKSVLSYANAGATSLFTTAEDLIKWSNNFTNPKVGSANVMKQMHRRGILNKGDTLDYAFGQRIETYKGLKAASHGGADAGYRSYLIRFPEQKYTIAILSNLASINTGRIAYQIADIYLKDHLREEIKIAEPAPVAAPETVSVSEELMKLYSGQYELQPGVVISVRLENGKLVGQATGQPSVVLVPRTENQFEVLAANAKITFVKSTGNSITELVLDQNGHTTKAPRLKDFDAASVDLSKYTGVFYSPELETQYTFIVKDKKLIAKHIRHEPIEFTPTKERTFSSNAWFMGNLEFVTNEKGDITGMKVSSGRVKDVKFEKLR